MNHTLFSEPRSNSAPSGLWDRFLQSRFAPWLTHGSLILLSAALWLLLWLAPCWIAFALGVLLAHRIGVLQHEYLHGIPFQNLATEWRRNIAGGESPRTKCAVKCKALKGRR